MPSRLSLVDVHGTAAGRNGRIPGDNRNTGIHRFLAGGHQRIGIIGRDSQTVDVLGDQRVEQLDLLGRIGHGGALIGHV